MGEISSIANALKLGIERRSDTRKLPGVRMWKRLGSPSLDSLHNANLTVFYPGPPWDCSTVIALLPIMIVATGSRNVDHLRSQAVGRSHLQARRTYSWMVPAFGNYRAAHRVLDPCSQWLWGTQFSPRLCGDGLTTAPSSRSYKRRRENV
ncbi:MAG: hypothetical protein Q9159_002594 [Coniocarpon cinnabarinum]